MEKNKEKVFTKLNHHLCTAYQVNVDCEKCPHLIIFRETTPHEIAHAPSISAYISPIENFNTTKIVRKTISSQPDCFKNLSYHDTNLLAMCYGMGGFEWPSGKKLYQFCHHRVYSYFIKKIKPRYIDSNGKFKMKIIECGTINHHTDEYRNALIKRNIKLPEIIFCEHMPNIVVEFYNCQILFLKIMD